MLAPRDLALTFCARDIDGSYMLAPKDLLVEIQSQFSTVSLFTLKFQFLFDIYNNESYPTLKDTLM